LENDIENHSENNPQPGVIPMAGKTKPIVNTIKEIEKNKYR